MTPAELLAALWADFDAEAKRYGYKGARDWADKVKNDPRAYVSRRAELMLQVAEAVGK